MDVYWTVGLIAPLLAFYLLMVWSRSRVLSRLVGRDPAVRLGYDGACLRTLIWAETLLSRSWAGVHSIQGRRQHMVHRASFAYMQHRLMDATFLGRYICVSSRVPDERVSQVSTPCCVRRLVYAAT